MAETVIVGEEEAPAVEEAAILASGVAAGAAEVHEEMAEEHAAEAGAAAEVAAAAAQASIETAVGVAEGVEAAQESAAVASAGESAIVEALNAQSIVISSLVDELRAQREQAATASQVPAKRTRKRPDRAPAGERGGHWYYR